MLTPASMDQTQDYFYAQVHLTAPAVVYLKTDSKTTTFNGVAGVNRFGAPLEVGSGVEVLVVSLYPSFPRNNEAHRDGYRDVTGKALHL
jgi:hypothetical protein